MGLIADRRQARDERLAEERLRGLAADDDRRAIYVPGHIIATLGPLRVQQVLREYGATASRTPL